jgi:hypothetical protein
MNTRARSQIDNQVGRPNRRFIMLDHQHAVPNSFEASEGA